MKTINFSGCKLNNRNGVATILHAVKWDKVNTGDLKY